jgi:hypothetical protein
VADENLADTRKIVSGTTQRVTEYFARFAIRGVAHAMFIER